MRSTLGTDDELVLSRYPVVAHELHFLYRGFRSVAWVRIDHPIGPVDVFSTHLSSSSDGAQNPCAADCPPECVAAGARESGRELARSFGTTRDGAAAMTMRFRYYKPPKRAIVLRLGASDEVGNESSASQVVKLPR